MRVRESCNLSFVSVCGRVRMDMRAGAGCVWVVPLRAEWLSEMTVINSFTLVPVGDIVNHIYWWFVGWQTSESRLLLRNSLTHPTQQWLSEQRTSVNLWCIWPHKNNWYHAEISITPPGSSLPIRINSEVSSWGLITAQLILPNARSWK